MEIVKRVEQKIFQLFQLVVITLVAIGWMVSWLTDWDVLGILLLTVPPWTLGIYFAIRYRKAKIDGPGLLAATIAGCAFGMPTGLWYAKNPITPDHVGWIILIAIFALGISQAAGLWNDQREF